MKQIMIAALLLGLLLVTPSYGQAPSWSDAQAEVWAVVQQSWKDDAGETGRWPNEYAHDKFVSWWAIRPAPLDRETYARWERTYVQAADTFWYEMTPLAIVVEGETAVKSG